MGSPINAVGSTPAPHFSPEGSKYNKFLLRCDAAGPAIYGGVEFESWYSPLAYGRPHT